MRFRLLPISLVLLALTVLAALPASARHRDRRFNDRRTRIIVVDRSPRVTVFQDRGFFVDRSPRVTVFRDRDLADRPHGWNRGRKVGWGNCDLPPGLAKKYGCNSSFRNDNRRVNQRPVIVLPLPFIR
ncbi:MAG: hypothetical protein ACRD4U_11720 [Candidatus Acidiferrales bacterium]